LLEAVKNTLLDHPLIRSQQAQVQISMGLRNQASGAFDRLLTSGLNVSRTNLPLSNFQQEQDAALGIPGSDQVVNGANYGIGVQQLFRNGISITPQFQLGRTTDNLFNSGGLNTSTLNIVVNVPLLRGRGRAVVGAQEHAAEIEVDAALLDLNQTLAQLVSNTASSYWNLVAARRNLDIAVQAEDRGNIYFQNVQQLAAADRVPRNDLHEVTANLAQRSATRVAAEQAMLAAQGQLAVDMALSTDQMRQGLPQARDEFPAAEDQDLPPDSRTCVEYYSDQALQRRADYLATGRRYDEARTLLNAAKNRLLPQLDLNFSNGYSGLQEGRNIVDFVGAAKGAVGPTATAGISFSFPPSNQAARGLVMQSEGAAVQADMQSRQLGRTINSSVIVSLEALRNAITRAKKARVAVESYQSALAGEREKYAGGIGSIVDILTVEDRLTAALSDQVQAELSYALALTQFRFATGTLVRPRQSSQNISEDMLLTFPFSCSSRDPGGAGAYE
jgi:outer membrane protein TolC